MKIWKIENTYDGGRAIQIYEAIKALPWQSLVDIGCGFGLIADSLKWVFPQKDITQFDLREYSQWDYLTRVQPSCMDIMDFIKENRQYDIVMLLNAYRNWEGKEKALFNDWLSQHAKYFITSASAGAGTEDPLPGKTRIQIGQDSKGFPLFLYKI